MNGKFFQQVEVGLAPERLDVYRQDGASHAVTLARYLCNMALCEALYSPLQIAEIALRNAIHKGLSVRFGSDRWYDNRSALSTWQQQQVFEARKKLQDINKPVTPGRIVAELHFGFWTGYFNKSHAGTGLGHSLAHSVFSGAPRLERDMKKLDARWTRIRDLRNRVFHHERIVHWTDLDAQHADILTIIGWISPSLCDLAQALDRYSVIRKGGLQPWLDKLRHHWPDPAGVTPANAAKSVVAIVPDAVDPSSGAKTPFGHRWGGDVIRLSGANIDAIQTGQTLAVDVQNEYVVFLKKSEPAKATSTAGNA